MVDDFSRKIQRGLEIFGNGVDSVSKVTRSLDGSVKAVDDALRGSTPPPHPSQAFTNIITHLISMRDMARGGFANSPSVAQKAREILSMVNQIEPPWKSQPANIRTRSDMTRTAIRDLRGSQALQRLAQGYGTSDEINALIGWSNDVDGRIKGYPEVVPPAPEPLPTNENVRENIHENIPAGVPGMGKVTTEATIEHQHKEMRKHMLLLEGHLQQGCKIGGVACDCCEKHPIIILGLAEEAIGMVNNPLYNQIMTWCSRISPITTEEASASGKYDQQYPTMAIELRELRKSLPNTKASA